MIVRPVDGAVQLITQPDHAFLARAIMERCVALSDRPRRETILHAIAGHDAGWAEEDAAPTVDPQTGAVVDFIHVPVRVRHSVWPRTIAQLSGDPWAAALVAHHAITVYDRFRSDAEWTPFFAKMERARAAMVRASAIALDELAADYAFVRLGDLISLAFCTGSTDRQQFGAWTIQLAGTRVVVSPDVFGEAKVPIQINARVTLQQHFQSDQELRDAIAVAPMTTLRGDVAGTRGAHEQT